MVTLASSVLTYLAQKSGGAVSSEMALPLWVRFCNAAMSYWRYLGKMVWPSPLMTYYHHEARSIQVPLALFFALLLVAASVFCWRARTKRPYLLFGWLWYVGTLVPVIGFPVQVGVQAMAERYSYIPLVGIFAALVWFIGDYAEKLPKAKNPLAGLSIVIVGTMIALTMNQVKVWKNTITLFSHVLEVDPRGEFPNLSLGAAYMREKNYDQSKRYLEYALKYNPAGPQTLSYYSFCLMERDHHDPSDLPVAQQSLERAYLVAPTNKDVLVNLADLCLKRGRSVEAEDYARRVLAISPDFLTARYYLADALQAQNRLPEAEEVYRKVLAEDPANTDAYNNLGIILYTEGKRDEAFQAFKRSLAVKPQALAHSNLGRIYFEAHQVQAAIAELEEAIRLDPANAIAHNNLGAVYYQQGDYGQAAQQFGQALQCNPNYGEALGNFQRAQAMAYKAQAPKAASGIKQ